MHVQPIYGWGWSDSSGAQLEVPAPFDLEITSAENKDFKVALGRLEQSTHPLCGMWVVLSPIQAVGTWDYCHLCAFRGERPTLTKLEELIQSAAITGFAKAVLSQAETPPILAR